MQENTLDLIVVIRMREVFNMSARYILNDMCNGVEIYFDDRPEDDILDELHQSKWRWHKKKRCW